METELLIENVLNIGTEEFYRHERYKTPLYILLLNTTDKNAFNILEENIRKTDVLQQLTSELLVVFLTHTEHDNALLFINKIKEKINFTYTLSEFKEPKLDFIESLFMENSKKYSLEN